MKYAPLANYLAALDDSEWRATFREIEVLLGFTLPKSAYHYQAWWANQTTPGHSQNLGWSSVGWRTEELNLIKQQVVFRTPRTKLSPASAARPPAVESSAPLTIAQAKDGLSKYYDVSLEKIEITIRG